MVLKLMVSRSWSTVARCLMGGILIRERRMLVRYRFVSRRRRCLQTRHIGLKKDRGDRKSYTCINLIRVIKLCNNHHHGSELCTISLSVFPYLLL